MEIEPIPYKTKLDSSKLWKLSISAKFALFRFEVLSNHCSLSFFLSARNEHGVTRWQNLAFMQSQPHLTNDMIPNSLFSLRGQEDHAFPFPFNNPMAAGTYLSSRCTLCFCTLFSLLSLTGFLAIRSE